MRYQALLEGLTVLELTAVYNALADVNAPLALAKIDSFHTKQDGVKRLMWLIAESRMTIDKIIPIIPEDTVRHKLESLAKEQTKEMNQKIVTAKNNNVNANVVPAVAAKKIKLIAQTNPKRKGSASHDRYALYKDGMSVGDALKAGVTKADLAWDQKKGFIKLED